ncbi:hypothetical protein BGZ63DRAFT_390450 [Mariannaea sp. PMI_226]|nr:hypothetical protein BGZ63DRAFT_390450 [Mariannaea sp. PMI_226]
MQAAPPPQSTGLLLACAMATLMDAGKDGYWVECHACPTHPRSSMHTDGPPQTTQTKRHNDKKQPKQSSE